jgi:hypothetical protein
VGAIWVYALERPIAASISITRNRIEDPACEAVQLLGHYRIDGITVESLQITGEVTSVFALQTGGSMNVYRVSSSDPPSAPAVEVPRNFALTYGEANKGWTIRKADQPAAPTCEGMGSEAEAHASFSSAA